MGKSFSRLALCTQAPWRSPPLFISLEGRPPPFDPLASSPDPAPSNFRYPFSGIVPLTELRVLFPFRVRVFSFPRGGPALP